MKEALPRYLELGLGKTPERQVASELARRLCYRIPHAACGMRHARFKPASVRAQNREEHASVMQARAARTKANLYVLPGRRGRPEGLEQLMLR